jgi:hypothetical protein
MDLRDRAVQAHRFDLDADNLLFLHLFEQLIQYAGFGPTVHAGIDRMPRSKAFGQGSPLTAVLCDIQNRVDHGQIFVRNIAALARQILLDATEPFGRFPCRYYIS